jgi:hypothetical protein
MLEIIIVTKTLEQRAKWNKHLNLIENYNDMVYFALYSEATPPCGYKMNSAIVLLEEGVELPEDVKDCIKVMGHPCYQLAAKEFAKR